jgi:hypothetical protein
MVVHLLAAQSFSYHCVQSVACNDGQMIVMNIKILILMHVSVFFSILHAFTVPTSRHGKTE